MALKSMHRVRQLEAEICAGDFAALLSEQNEAKLDLLARYYKRFEATLLRCTRELRACRPTAPHPPPLCPR